MIDPEKKQEPNDTQVFFTSEDNLVEVKEANTTQPSQPSKRHREWMEAKWGRKNPPANGSTQKDT